MIKRIIAYFTTPYVARLVFIRKDRLTTGYVSEVYVNGKYRGYALDTLSLDDVELKLSKSAFVVDEFTYHHRDGVICLEPNNQLYDQLAHDVYVTIDSSRMPLEC